MQQQLTLPSPSFSVQGLLGRVLVPEQEHLLQPEHLQLDDVSGGHGDQDCWGAGVRQSWGLSQVSTSLMQLQADPECVPQLGADGVGQHWRHHQWNRGH